MDTIATVLGRIDRDMALLRTLVIPPAAKLNGHAKSISDTIPVIRKTYSKQAAIRAKDEIEAAFLAGVIDFDKKRGLKMLVTKATNGWASRR